MSIKYVLCEAINNNLMFPLFFDNKEDAISEMADDYVSIRRSEDEELRTIEDDEIIADSGIDFSSESVMYISNNEDVYSWEIFEVEF